MSPEEAMARVLCMWSGDHPDALTFPGEPFVGKRGFHKPSEEAVQGWQLYIPAVRWMMEVRERMLAEAQRSQPAEADEKGAT
jgi:hypothetical protein